MSSVLIVCVLLLLEFSHEVTSIISEKKGKHDINVVLFFADTTPGVDYHNNSGVKYLNFEEKPHIKHCSHRRDIDENLVRLWRFKRSCHCNEDLKSNLVSLMNYVQNNLGMITGMGSISEHNFGNNVHFGTTEIKIGDKFPTKNRTRFDDDNSLEVLPNPLHENLEEESTTGDSSTDEEIRKISLLNAFPKDTPPLFPLIRKKRSDNVPYILDPEHTEVFKVRTKRAVNVRPKQISDSSTYLNKPISRSKTIYDILDILTLIKISFLNNLFEDTDLTRHVLDEHHPLDSSILGKQKQPGLFEIVQKTLYSMLESGDYAFLMIILGGNLSDISSPYSPLMQSVKHVIENTDDSNTLIVITGTCPYDCKGECGGTDANKEEKYLLPLYARGCMGSL